jgi:hypothetical protein
VGRTIVLHRFISKVLSTECHFTSKDEGYCTNLSSDAKLRNLKEFVLNTKKQQYSITSQKKLQEAVIQKSS